jgi:TonB family protein
MSESTPKRIVLATFALAAASIPMTFGAKSAVAQDDEALTPLVRVAPAYPPRTATCESGAVAVRFTVDTDGTTKDIEVLESSSRFFEAPVVEAVSKWRYTPPTENGSPAEKRGLQTVLRFERCGRSAVLPSERTAR